MLHAKYLTSRPYGSGEDDFSGIYTGMPQGGANLTPRVMILTNLVEDLYTMLHVKYLNSRHSYSGEEDF